MHIKTMAKVKIRTYIHAHVELVTIYSLSNSLTKSMCSGLSLRVETNLWYLWGWFLTTPSRVVYNLVAFSLLVSFTYSLVFSRMDTVMSPADRRWRAKAFGSSEIDCTILSLNLTSTLYPALPVGEWYIPTQ